MFTFNVTSFKINKAIYFISSGYSIQNFFFALCIIDNDTENEKKKKKKKKQERIGISRWKRLIELFLPVFHNVLFIDDKNWVRLGLIFYSLVNCKRAISPRARIIPRHASPTTGRCCRYFPPSFLHREMSDVTPMKISALVPINCGIVVKYAVWLYRGCSRYSIGMVSFYRLGMINRLPTLNHNFQWISNFNEPRYSLFFNGNNVEI